MKITGTFEVKLQPQESYAEGSDGVTLARMSIDKSFSGGLSGTSKGEMLSALTPVQGSAGYVAIEQFSGELSGKKGSFAIQHFGTMHDNEQFQLLEVVPDSGSDELTGIAGNMLIKIVDDQHEYEFEYELNE